MLSMFFVSIFGAFLPLLERKAEREEGRHAGKPSQLRLEP